MDTSKQYIAMCDCPEIQDKWEFKQGDFYKDKVSLEVLDEDVEGYTTDNCQTYTREYLIQEIKDYEAIWLPRQDQLQEMLMNEPYPKTPAIGRLQDLTNFVHTTPYCQEKSEEDEACHYFETLEQLWLAFVMKEKFNKHWDDGWV